MSNILIAAEELLRRYGAGERNFSGATVEGDLSYADLSGIDLSHARLSDCYMAHVNLSGANLRNASLIEVCLNAANLAGADLRGCRLGRTSFSGADLTDADLRDVECHDTNFTRANLTGANLRGVDLDATLERANLTGANLEGASLGRTSFWNTIMPDGHSLNRIPLNVFRLLFRLILCIYIFSFVSVVVAIAFQTILDNDFSCGISTIDPAPSCSRAEFFVDQLSWMPLYILFSPFILPSLASSLFTDPFNSASLYTIFGMVVGLIPALCFFRFSRSWR
ncbi:MAG: pentapeptide repeat-containing protein [Scytolyngbya sp. HA4215-MV1]|nr:pentapeptide repeat-containing protein [Scytolyngbya sp. HA4215-MV1]